MNYVPSFLLSYGALMRAARNNYDVGRYQKALRSADRALAKLGNGRNASPDTLSQIGEAWLLKGHILKRLDESAGAVDAFLASHRLGKSDADSIRFLSFELLRRGDRSSQARAVFLEYLSRACETDSPERVRKNLDLLEGLSAPDFQSEESDEATLRWNEKIISRRDELAWPHRHIGRILLSRAEWQGAIKALRQACEREQGDYETRHMLAYALWKGGCFGEAKRLLDLLIESEPTRGVLLLRGHVLRSMGEAASAVLDYEQAGQNQPIDGDEGLAYAEALFNAGFLLEAAKQLELLSNKGDPRRVLLTAAVEQAEGHADKALRKLCQVIAVPGIEKQAVQLIIAISSNIPAPQGALDALDVVPSHCRDERYWSVRGNVLLGDDRAEEALDAWNHIENPAQKLINTMKEVARRCLSSLYNKADYDGVIAAVLKGLVKRGVSEEVKAIIAGALGRHIVERLRKAPTSAPYALGMIERVENYIPPGELSSHLDLIKGILHAYSGDYYQGFSFLSRLRPSDEQTAEALLQLARCALHVGDLDRCAMSIDKVNPEDQGTHRIKCAWAIARGRWHVALHYLNAFAPTPSILGLKAGVLLQAGEAAELERMEAVSGEVNYYQAVGNLYWGGGNQAAQILLSIPDEDRMRNAADSLLGWMRLQEAKELQLRGETEKALYKLADAIRLWPDNDDLLSGFTGLDGKSIWLFLAVGDRGRIRESLEAQATSAGLGEPASCHRLALFYLAEATRHAEAGEFEEAIESWERSIAYVAVPLANFTYMQEWVRKRSEDYKAQPTTEAALGIESRVLQHYDNSFDRWREYLTSRNKTRQAERLSDLALSARAELRAAQVLRGIGGIEAEWNPYGNISAGPAYVSLLGLEEEFADFLWTLKQERLRKIPAFSSNSGLSALLELLMESEADEDKDRVDASIIEELQILFSALRFAAMLEREGHLEEALGRLRQTEPRCAVLAEDETCKGILREACKRKRPNFPRCNPAFAGEKGTKRFRKLATEYEVQLLTKMGEKEIASPEDRLSFGIQHWREAISLAGSVKQHEKVTSEIRELAIGRAHILQQKDRTDPAIRLLEEINDLCGSSQVVGILANLYAVRGIDAGNAEQWEQAVTDLRRARALNPHSSYVNFNLIIALRLRASEIHESAPRQAHKLLSEAVELARKSLLADPHNSELRELMQLAGAELAMVSLMVGEVRPESLIETMLMASGQGAERLSTKHHNQGVERARKGDYKGAIQELEKALELEPTSEITRQVLAEVITAHAITLCNKGMFDEALARVERGLTFMPGNESLTRCHKEVSMRRLNKRLASGQASQEEFLEVLRHLLSDR